MSAESNPISPTRFAAALESLSIESLHAKAAELANSISHLQRSNGELEPYAAEGDRDCAEAIDENKLVIARMEERIGLLREEVEKRGMPWEHGGEKKEEVNGGAGVVNGPAQANGVVGAGAEVQMQDANPSSQPQQSESGRHRNELRAEAEHRSRLNLAAATAVRDPNEDEGLHL